MATDRAKRRTLIGFLLGGLLQELALQSLSLLEDLSFQIAHRLVDVANTPVQTGRQTRHPVHHRLAKRLVTAVGRNRMHAAVAHAFGSTTAQKNMLSTNEMRPALITTAPNAIIAAIVETH